MEAINIERIKNITLCKKCVLPENKPDMFFDSEGVCNICREFEKNKKEQDDIKFFETDFIKMLNQNKSKGKYDCLVMCSGGKDSTAALYYMKKRYKKNPLAFTFDHGFETEEALENIKNAVDALGIDFVFFKSDFMKEMFAKIIETNSKAVICHPCSIWYMQLTFDIAARFEIPVIIAGWTKGQSSKQPVMSKCGCNVHQPEFIAMARETQEFMKNYLKDHPKYKDFPMSMEEVLTQAKKKNKSIVLSPHWFLPVNSDEYVEIIQKELKWKYPKVSYPAKTTNCYLNFLSVYYSIKNFGYAHYNVEMSKMIREGLMTRDDALKLLEINFDEKLLQDVANRVCGVNNEKK